MSLFKKPSNPQLDIDDANKILQNIFEANQIEPSTIPLDIFAAYNNYRRKRFSLKKLFIIIIIILVLLLPLLFTVPSFSIDLTEAETNPVYQIKVNSFLPVKRVTASVNGHNIPVYETDSHLYSIEPDRNGRMTVTAVLINRQKTTHYIDVSNVDKDAPEVVSDHMDENNIYLYLSDTGSGVNYEKIKAVSLSGKKIQPVSYDEASECVVFPLPSESVNVYIPDNADNTLHLLLTIK